MYRALDYVNYDALRLSHTKDPRDKSTEPSEAPSLQLQCCDVLNDTASLHLQRWEPKLLFEAVKVLPLHMLTMLFRAAVDKQKCSAISRIISVWPSHTLCLRELLPPTSYSDIFQEEMGFDLVLFRGLLLRQKRCKMTCLDLRGFKLNKGFSALIVQLWPLIAMPRRTMADVKRLSLTVIRNAGLEKESMMANHFSAVLEQKISSLMSKCSDFHIHIGKGQELLVKLDSLQFTPSDTLSQDYLVAHCLRGASPLRIQVSQLYFRTTMYSIQSDNDFIMSPYIVLKGHDTQFLEGLSLRQLEDGLFKMVAPVLYRFKNLQAIELQDCNIYLQNGRTRSKTEDRKALCNFLSAFPLLVRLDLGFNYLVGCLGEVLDSVARPLQYLGLRGCDLDVTDLEALATSRHAESLRELNLSKISFCSVSYFLDEQSLGPKALVRTLQSFPHLAILNLSQISLPDSQVDELCAILRNNLRELKVLDLSAMVMTPQHQLEVCLACASIPSFQKLSITLVTSLVEELNQWNGVEDMVVTITDRLRDVGRWDIRLETVLFSRALFMDIVDDLQF